MRSSILPTGMLLFLLCLAGCGGGDSTETASAEGGGDGAAEPAGPEGGSDSAQMYGGGENRSEGSAGSSSAGDSAAKYGAGETRGEHDEEDSDDMDDPAGMYGEETRGEHDEEDSDDMDDPAQMYGEETRGEHDEGDPDDMEDAAEMYGGDPRGEHDEGDPDDMEDAAEMYGGDPRGEHDEGDSDDMENPAEMYGGGDDRRGPGGDGRRPGEAAKPKTFADMATQAFGQGRDTEAFQFLFAHAVTADDQSAGQLLSKMGWIAPLERPGLGVRWGVGIEFIPKGYNGNQLFPIGTTQKVQDRKSRGFGQGRREDGGGFGGNEDMGAGQGGFGGDMQGGRGGGGSNAQLERFTGELGQKVVDGLRERIERGDFGLVLKEAGSAGAPNQGRGAMGQGQNMQYGPGDDSGDGEDFGGGYNAGPSGDMRGAGGNRGAGAATQLVPGVTLVDVAPAKDLVKMAEQAGIDVLCVFKVTVTQIRRTGQISNKVEIQLYSIPDGKKTYETNELANLFVQAERAKEHVRGGDPVDKLLEKLFKEIDTNWRLAALPSLQDPENVPLFRARWEQLQEPDQNPLPALAEIRMYHTRKLIQDDHLLTAYQRKTNDHSGTILATGAEEERKQVIATWLPARR